VTILRVVQGETLCSDGRLEKVEGDGVLEQDILSFES
jgi:hypothetical protein